MFRPASRAVLRATSRHPPTSSRIQATHPSRFINTAPTTRKSRPWTSRFMRLGLAAGVVYYYNTSSIFSEPPTFSFLSKSEDDSPPPTSTAASPQTNQTAAKAGNETDPSDRPVSVADLEGQAEEEGAFNPETGEINWDCPCLGGMAHGPCGEEFKEAFSCFVFSNEEPKGIDCIDRFRGMQDCFRKHPDIYGSELEEDEVDDQLEEHIATAADENHSTPAPLSESTSASEIEASSETVKTQTGQL